MHRFVLLALLLGGSSGLLGCASSSSSEEEHPHGDTLFTSAGDERTNAAPEPISTGPAPLPLPSPPIPRGALSPELQRIWTEAEALMADGPPPAPDGDPNAESTAGLTDWVRRRLEGVQALIRNLDQLRSAPPYERAIGGALLGYAFEATAAETRGAPVGTAITSDPELFRAYREALDSVLLPFANQAAAGYQICQEMLDQYGDPQWGEWRAFCFERSEELGETYRDAMPETGSEEGPE